MGKLKNLPLKYQLIIIIFGISLASLWVASTAFVFYDRYAHKRSMEYELTVLARIVANQSAENLLSGRYREVQKNLDALSIKTDIVSACITNNSGETVALYLRNADGSEGACLHGGEFVSRFSFVHFDLIQPVLSARSDRIGELHIRQHLGNLNKRFQIFSVVVLLIVVLSSFVAILLSSRIQAFVSTPVSDLTDLAKRITRQQDYSLRASSDRGDEIGQLVLAFNMMLDTIEQQNRALKEATHTLEDQVEARTAALKNINRELEAFTYSVSHDLRSPLRSVTGFAAALAEDYGDRFDDTGRDYLFRIRSASEHMGTLIDSLLELSRVSRQEVNLQAVDLASMARDIAAELREHHPVQNVHFLTPPVLLAYGDKPLLRLLLNNLLENAWKYTSRVSVPRVELGSVERDGKSVYYVRDNGAGFDMKYADKLFGPFQRLHRQDEYEGLGIGLATVARIVYRHGGEIWAEGIPGEGAAFYFTLGTHSSSTA